MVGKTDPISYNVLGHMKLLVILTGGIVFFRDSTNAVRLFGMIMAFLGIISYTHIKLTQPTAPPAGDQARDAYDGGQGGKMPMKPMATA